jgi:hypothetical protein
VRQRKAQLAIEAAIAAFVDRFGREPRPGETLLFDQDAPGNAPVPLSEEKLNAEMIAAFLAADTPLHLIYVWQKTGLILNEEGYRDATRETKAEWDEAIEDFESMTRQELCAWERDLRKRYGVKETTRR